MPKSKEKEFIEKYASTLINGINKLRKYAEADYNIFNNVYSEIKENLFRIESQMMENGISIRVLGTKGILNLESLLLKFKVDRTAVIFGSKKKAI